MSRPVLEVADILRRHGDTYREDNAGHLSRGQLKVMGAVRACRTAALGGHVERCGDCGHSQIAYNSCGNRHCPKCRAGAAHGRLQARQADLLPVEYFHVVFTLPTPIASIGYQNKAVVYAILFEAAAETLRTIAADKKHLGAKIGITMVLHSWGQTLTHHPHVHCIVPGGGLSPDGARWIGCRRGFFLPARVLSRLFRRLFVTRLLLAHQAGKLRFWGDLAGLAEAGAFAARLAPLRRVDWVVYAKRPFAGPGQVLAYLSRYTHRIAISNRRLIAQGQGRVTFSWRDYAHGAAQKRMTLDAAEFIRRFLLHVLPDGFQRIRHYGFWPTAGGGPSLPLSAGCSLPLPPQSMAPRPRNRRHPNRTHARRHAPVAAGSWSSSRSCPAQGAARSSRPYVPDLTVHDRKAIAHAHDRRAGIEPRSQILAQALANDGAHNPRHSNHPFRNREPSRQIPARPDNTCHCAHRQIHRGRSIPIAIKARGPRFSSIRFL